MSSKQLVRILVVVMTCSLAAAPAVKKKPASSQTSSQKKITSNRKTPTRRSTTARRKARKPAVPSWRNTQRSPSPERYLEIQQALADRGYLEGAGPSGIWDAGSVAALKRFQQDQNLTASGKIDSLSLIALGLGPRHDQSASQTAVPPDPQ